MFGILNLFKPSGPTSRDCVNQIQRLIRPIKVGHAGTLDPIADGVLLVAMGQAVRLVDWLHLLPKSYRGTFEFGKTSPSADSESEITKVTATRIPNREELDAILPEFLGSILQVPPIYSAIKVDGKRAYQRAREGQQVDMPSRQVMIHQLSIVDYQYPRLILDIDCGTGTYVRSLGRDIARRLGSDAIMTELRRTSIGDMSSEHAVKLEQLDSLESIRSVLINPVECLSMLDRVTLDESDIRTLHQGKNLALPGLERLSQTSPSEYVMALDSAGVLRSILNQQDDGNWRPHRNFLEPTS
ncbi:MAG: tRNA pseudouridine(55) synthase TruB [Pirellulaceae bacterium]|nr:tRNA pseudouridine(55) synthase TruB [Pirellulaceae bacterium]